MFSNFFNHQRNEVMMAASGNKMKNNTEMLYKTFIRLSLYSTPYHLNP